jgi:putative SOS response-associated peptidase YedK
MWKNKAGDYVPTVSVITSKPNEAMAEIHDRQPMILIQTGALTVTAMHMLSIAI